MGNSTSTKILTITREFAVPPELIWKAWTNPNLFKKWYGPEGYSCPSCEMDIREGGKYLHCMRSPKGEDSWSTGVYKEINPMEKLVYTETFSDEEGKVLPASHFEEENYPLESEIAIILESEEAKTRMTLQHAGIPEGDMQDKARIGWNQSFDKLTASLKKRTQWS